MFTLANNNRNSYKFALNTYWFYLFDIWRSGSNIDISTRAFHWNRIVPHCQQFLIVHKLSKYLTACCFHFRVFSGASMGNIGWNTSIASRRGLLVGPSEWRGHSYSGQEHTKAGHTDFDQNHVEKALVPKSILEAGIGPSTATRWLTNGTIHARWPLELGTRLLSHDRKVRVFNYNLRREFWIHSNSFSNSSIFSMILIRFLSYSSHFSHANMSIHLVRWLEQANVGWYLAIGERRCS